MCFLLWCDFNISFERKFYLKGNHKFPFCRYTRVIQLARKLWNHNQQCKKATQSRQILCLQALPIFRKRRACLRFICNWLLETALQDHLLPEESAFPHPEPLPLPRQLPLWLLEKPFSARACLYIPSGSHSHHFTLTHCLTAWWYYVSQNTFNMEPAYLHFIHIFIWIFFFGAVTSNVFCRK